MNIPRHNALQLVFQLGCRNHKLTESFRRQFPIAYLLFGTAFLAFLFVGTGNNLLSEEAMLYFNQIMVFLALTSSIQGWPTRTVLKTKITQIHA